MTAAPQPVPLQRAQQPGGHGGLLPVNRPAQRGPHVVLLGIEAFQPLDLFGVFQAGRALIGERRRPVGVAAPGKLGIARQRQPFPRVLADRGLHLPPRPRAGAGAGEQVLLGQRGEASQQCRPVAGTADGLDGI